MIIRCWGARGSIPVSGEAYLKYGGDTTCIEIRTNNDDIIIIDAGSGIRRLGNSLMSEKRHQYAMFFTHAHWDHLMGFPFFKPIYFKQTEISMYGCPFVQTSVRDMIARVMAPPNFPVNYEDIRAKINYHETCETEFLLNSMKVTSIALSHPNQGMGFRFEENGKNFVFLTDNEITYRHSGGLDYEDYLKFSADADLLIHDAEYNAQEYTITRTWGHSVYLDVLDLAMKAGVKKLGLFHHNQERSDSAIDAIVENCHRIVRERRSPLDCFALDQITEIVL